MLYGRRTPAANRIKPEVRALLTDPSHPAREQLVREAERLALSHRDYQLAGQLAAQRLARLPEAQNFEQEQGGLVIDRLIAEFEEDGLRRLGGCPEKLRNRATRLRSQPRLTEELAAVCSAHYAREQRLGDEDALLRQSMRRFAEEQQEGDSKEITWLSDQLNVTPRSLARWPSCFISISDSDAKVFEGRRSVARVLRRRLALSLLLAIVPSRIVYLVDRPKLGLDPAAPLTDERLTEMITLLAAEADDYRFRSRHLDRFIVRLVLRTVLPLLIIIVLNALAINGVVPSGRIIALVFSLGWIAWNVGLLMRPPRPSKRQDN